MQAIMDEQGKLPHGAMMLPLSALACGGLADLVPVLTVRLVNSKQYTAARHTPLRVVCCLSGPAHLDALRSSARSVDGIRPIATCSGQPTPSFAPSWSSISVISTFTTRRLTS
jgi:hypothetical protein